MPSEGTKGYYKMQLTLIGNKKISVTNRTGCEYLKRIVKDFVYMLPASVEVKICDDCKRTFDV